MSAINKKNAKSIFKSKGVQLPTESLQMIDEHLNKEIHKMAERCKQGNVKRLTPNLLWVALGRNLW